MTVLYIILGIIVGVPVYLLLNTLLALFARPFTAMSEYLWPGIVYYTFITNEFENDDGSFIGIFGRATNKIFGWLVLIAALSLFILSLIYRFFWLVYRGFRVWCKLVKSCWKLGGKTKAKTKAKAKTK